VIRITAGRQYCQVIAAHGDICNFAGTVLRRLCPNPRLCVCATVYVQSDFFPNNVSSGKEPCKRPHHRQLFLTNVCAAIVIMELKGKRHHLIVTEL